MNDHERLIYSGHRARMRERLRLAGFEAMATYELLEMLLYHKVTRRDTHPMAKMLLLELGGLAGVLSADADELAEVEGIGQSTARLVFAVGKLINTDCAEASASQILDTGAAARHFIEFFRDTHGPCVALASLDNSMRVISTELILEGRLSSGALKPRDFVTAALRSKASRVVLGASAPFGAAVAGDGDISGAKLIADELAKLDIPTVAAILTSGDEYTRLDGVLRTLPERAEAQAEADETAGEGLYELLLPVINEISDEPERIAHALADTYRTKEALFIADEQRIEAITGDKAVAELIRLVAYLASRSITETVKYGKRYSEDELLSFLKGLYMPLATEVLYVLSFDDEGRLLSADKALSAGISNLSPTARLVAECAVRHSASAAVLAHNHPGGDVRPSTDDVNATRVLADGLAAAGVKLRAHYVISGKKSQKILF